MDFQGLENIQLFKYKDKFFNELNDGEKDDFTDELFTQIIALVNKYIV